MKLDRHISSQIEPWSYSGPGASKLLMILTRQEVRGRFSSIWVWLVATCVCLMAAVYGAGFQRSFETETVLVSSNPLVVLNALVVGLVSLVLGLRLATSLSWEREHRTLEVLLVSPVSQVGVIAAKFLAEVATLIALLGIYFAYLLLAQPMGRGVLGVDTVADLWMTAVFVLPLMAFGLSVSSCLSSVRAAVVSFLVLVVLLCGIEIATQILRVQSPKDLSLTVLYLRSGLETVQIVLSKVSPVAYLSDVALAAADVAVLTVGRAVSALVLTCAILISSVAISLRKGPQ